ncbi:hypothetical protein H1C71_029506 [Ictidomys tridecemlineatus]|nr:hypothetical protein H1C71_029506 [Ictidomys tridecemlineatus]
MEGKQALFGASAYRTEGRGRAASPGTALLLWLPGPSLAQVIPQQPHWLLPLLAVGLEVGLLLHSANNLGEVTGTAQAPEAASTRGRPECRGDSRQAKGAWVLDDMVEPLYLSWNYLLPVLLLCKLKVLFSKQISATCSLKHSYPHSCPLEHMALSGAPSGDSP